MSEKGFCPRCKQQLRTEHDIYGYYEECFLCGYTNDIDFVQPKRVNKIASSDNIIKPESKGIGKLYTHKDHRFIAYIDYLLFESPVIADWWGELTIFGYVPFDEDDVFAIEFKGKLEGRCYLNKIKSGPLNKFPYRDLYSFTGISPIAKQTGDLLDNNIEIRS